MNYQERVKNVFVELKQINRFDELIAQSICIDDNGGYLICISELYANCDEVVTLLAKWRREATALHDQFEVTFEGTKKWLRELVLDVPDRILFLVTDKCGLAIGHMGFAHAFNEDLEFDLVVRGVHSVAPGIMSLAARALFNWANQTIEPKNIYVQVLEGNIHAVQFYTRLGFEFESKELRRGEYHIRMRRMDEKD